MAVLTRTGNNQGVQLELYGKNKLHEELGYRSLIWLSNRATQMGMRGNTEIYLRRGYAVDAVALHHFQYRYDLRYGSLDKVPNTYISLFEIKCSHGDFVSTFIKDNHFGSRLEPFGNFHWIVTPKGLLKKEEIPEFWGLLEASGRGLREIKSPLFIYPKNFKKNHIKVTRTILWGHDGWGNRIQKIKYCPDCHNESLIK